MTQSSILRIAVLALSLAWAQALGATEPPTGWRRARFGMTEAELVAALDNGRLVCHDGGQGPGGTVARFTLDDVDVAGERFVAGFNFERKQGRLASVLLVAAEPRSVATGHFEELNSLLTTWFGPPATTKNEGERERLSRWKWDGASIVLKYADRPEHAARYLSVYIQGRLP